MKKPVKLEITVSIPKEKSKKSEGLMLPTKRKMKKDNLGKKTVTPRLKDKVKQFGK